MDHIGEKTGWNYGQVTNTCVDFGSYNEYQQANFGAFCQVMTDFYTDHGDSGGPVFAWDGRDGATLLGIVVGKDDQGYSYFSSYAEILSDFGFGAGVINATTGTSLGAMTISGSVSGSNPVPSWSTPTVTNGNSGATTYAVYRATFDGTTGQFTEPEEVITGAYVGNQWLDLERTATQYVGTTRPPVRTSYVSYRVVAYNTGVSAQTSTVYFTTN